VPRERASPMNHRTVSTWWKRGKISVFFPVHPAAVILLPDLVDDVLDQIQHAVPGPDRLPRVRRRVALLDGWVTRTAEPDPVERQGPVFRPRRCVVTYTRSGSTGKSVRKPPVYFKGSTEPELSRPTISQFGNANQKNEPAPKTPHRSRTQIKMAAR
jgi:hypothetical protein